MTIPVLNIYYLLCYAWDRIGEGNTVDLESEKFDGPIDLFAKVLNDGVSRLISRGLDRDYLVVHEDIRGIKGKLDLATTVKRNLLLNGKTHCSFDEFSYDVPQNRILKATLRCLTQVDSLNKSERQRSERLYRKLGAISDVRLNAKMFHTVRIHRNNRFYRFLLHICHIIHENLLINEVEGTTQFLDFREDKEEMGRVFEKFVRNFCRRETSYKVSAQQIKWFKAKGSDSDLKYLPQMQTDIVLRSTERTIIIDTKYYGSPLDTTRWSSEKVRSGHLYQIYTYVTNEAAKAPPDTPAPEGWLLYAAVDRDIDFHFELVGRRFRVCSINLSQDWKKIEEDLLLLVEEKNRNGDSRKIAESFAQY
ncbi:MAG: 5-methylcytosine-specific restriction endonuclease system specificity protein McrC [Bacteroidota bacterium]|nr:5-methylcytosine-specific restriction endonuclease system specificity protein McrC [Bacteroidota bacterium]